MSYTFAITRKGPVASFGHRTIEADVAVSGTEVAGVGGTVDIPHTEGPYDGSVYKSPVSVEIVRRKSPTASDNDVAVLWDYANDDTTNGTIRIKVVNDDGVTANGLANLEFRVLMHFRTLKAGGIG